MQPLHWFKGLCLLWLLFPSAGFGQVTADGTLTTTVSTSNGLDFGIDAGNQVSGNLFHSFQAFSVPTGGSATFNNAIDVQNIIGRVTGGTVSNINGLIQANGTANLFLINPSGIVFGPNASLNIGGSFIGSTANSLQFADGTEFSAINPSAPLLTISVPIGLQVSANSGAIRVQGDGNNLSLDSNGVVSRDDRPVGLQVPTDRTLALVGGNLILEGGNLTASGGRIELGSVAGGTVRLNLVGSSWILDYAGVRGFQDIQLTQAASIDTSGSGSGAIHLQGRSIVLKEGSAILGHTLGNRSGADLVVQAAESVELSGENAFGVASLLGTRVETDAIAPAGNILVQANNVLLQAGSLITSETFGTGDSGRITLRVTKSVELKELDSGGFASGITTIAGSLTSGKAGDVTIDTERLLLRNGAQVSAVVFDRGTGGNVAVRATDVELSGTNGSGLGSFISTQLEREAIGSAGNLVIETNRLLLRDGATVSSGTFGRGNSGNLTIRAADTVTLSGFNARGLRSTLSTQVNSTGVGNAGNLTIETNQLRLQDGATVSSGTFGQGNGGSLTIRAADVMSSGLDNRGAGSYITTQVNPTGVGNAGDLTIETKQLWLQDGAVVSSSTLGRGNGGNLTIRAAEVQLSGSDAVGRSSILATQVASTGVGNAGNLAIEANQLRLQDGTVISAATFGRGNGGNLTIHAAETVALSGLDVRGLGGILATQVASTGVGNAGNLTIETAQLQLQNSATVSSATLGQGNGGNLTVRAAKTVAMSGLDVRGRSSLLTTQVAPTGVGNAGNLTVETGQLILQNGAQVTSTTRGVGNGGSVAVQATESIELSGLSGSSGSGIETVVARGARGNAGALTLETRRLRLQDQAAITSATNGSGNANNLTVQAKDSVFLTDNSRLSTQTQGGGEAGNLALTTDLLTLQNGGQLIVSGQGRFPSGNLAVNANSIRLNNQASLRAETEAGDRGSIFLNAQDIVLRRNSTITTNATNAATGGNITIDADILLLTENSAIVAQAMFGRGGNITITAQGLFQLLGTRIDASSELGIDGVVQINTPDVDPSRQLVELPSDLIDSQRLIANSCLVPSDRRQGTFVLTGVGGLPSLPTSPLRSPFETYAVPANAAVAAQSRSNHQNSNSVTEIQDIYRLENGQLMLGRRCP